MEQYFILDGILKRVVTNHEAKEMILRFSSERDIETSYAAWRLKKPTPYSIVCVTKARVAQAAADAVGRFHVQPQHRQERVRARGDEPDERHHGATPSPCTCSMRRAACTVLCGSTEKCWSACQRSNSLLT
jgi:hypothetical protein